MNSNRQFTNQPIESLQTMLRAIRQNDDRYRNIIPNGIYGPETQAAVSSFQREHGLPITGVTDQNTWDEIVKQYELALIENSSPQAIDTSLGCAHPFSKGDSSPYLLLAQCMLQEIARKFGCVCCPELNGTMDELMQNSVSDFQLLCDLPMSGKLDKLTWKYLVLHYPFAVIFEEK